jgi:hypothetical protein
MSEYRFQAKKIAASDDGRVVDSVDRALKLNGYWTNAYPAIGQKRC